MRIGSDAWNTLVINGSRELGVSLTHQQADMMAVHAKELLNWNKTSNLTAITDPYAVAVKHFVDSIAPVPYVKKGSRTLDIGAGGGFPGIVMKIVEPSLEITLVDAVRKKVSFLQYIIRKLKLEKISALHDRAQNLGKQPGFKGEFDVVICRAFSSIESFAQLALPFLKYDGAAVALKGKPEDPAIESLMGKDWRVSRSTYRLPGIEANRCIYTLRKTANL